MEINYLLERYGFPKEKVVKLNPNAQFRLGMELSEEKQKELKDIFELREAPLVPLLEDIVRIVNDSMECGGDDLTTKYLIQKAGYKPTGKETVTGMCDVAGRMIRNILQALNIEDIAFEYECSGGIRIPNPYIDYTQRYDSIVTHDSTVVCDEKGNWIVLNSKSAHPDKQFYVVPKEKLVYMGHPFVSEAEYQKVTKDFLTPEENAYLQKMDEISGKNEEETDEPVYVRDIIGE